MLSGQAFVEEMRICHEIAKPDDLTHGLRKLFLLRRLPPIHMQLLRHAVATDLMRRGADPAAVQRLLGHKHVSTTLGTYDHPDEEAVCHAMAQYSRAWDETDRQRSRDEGPHYIPDSEDSVGHDTDVDDESAA